MKTYCCWLGLSLLAVACSSGANDAVDSGPGATGSGGASSGGAAGGSGGSLSTGTGGAAVGTGGGPGGEDVRTGDAATTAEVGTGGTGGAGGSGGSGCSALFCESFEDVADGAPPDPAIWTRTSNDLVVDSTRAARGGKKSLHIPPLVSGAKYIRENKTIAAQGKAFYGRMYLWIDKQPTEKPASLYHWTMLSADELQDYNAGKVLRVGGHIEGAGTNWMRFNFQTHNMPGETGLSDQQEILKPQQWYCVEFYYSLPDNEARIWLDGVEDPKLHWKGPMGGYTFPAAVSWMTFGWAEYQAAKTPWEVWIDEIAIDTKKIGCN